MTARAVVPHALRTLFPPGEVALIEVSPGDPGPLTLRAWDMLQQADAIVHDCWVHPALVDRLPLSGTRYYTGKSEDHNILSQSEINELLHWLASQGMRVARLKGGEPLMFGRRGEEVSYLLEHGIGCRIVPGMTTAMPYRQSNQT